MKKDNDNITELLLFIFNLVMILTLIALGVMDNLDKAQELAQLKRYTAYIDNRCDELQEQNEKQQRQMDQDWQILTEGWKE